MQDSLSVENKLCHIESILNGLNTIWSGDAGVCAQSHLLEKPGAILAGFGAQIGVDKKFNFKDRAVNVGKAA